MNGWDSSDYKHNLLFLLGEKKKKRGSLFNYHFVREKTNKRGSGESKVHVFPLVTLIRILDLLEEQQAANSETYTSSLKLPEWPVWM